MYKLVLLRHGESTWNQENRFTGWTDVICPRRAGRRPRPAPALKTGATSSTWRTLGAQRAIRTLGACSTAGLDVDSRAPVMATQRATTTVPCRASTSRRPRQYGERGQIWRRSYDIPPPPWKDRSALPGQRSARRYKRSDRR